MSRLYTYLNQVRGTPTIPEELYYSLLASDDPEQANRLVDFGYSLKYKDLSLNQILGIEPDV